MALELTYENRHASGYCMCHILLWSSFSVHDRVKKAKKKKPGKLLLLFSQLMLALPKKK